MQKLTERMLLLGFLANLYKVEPKWCEEASKVRKWTSKGTKSEPKGTKSEPIGTERLPKGCQREPKGSKKEAKGSQTGAKGSQWEPNVSQRAAKTHAKIRRPIGVSKPVLGEVYLPLPPSTWAPRRRSRHRSARFAKRAGTCLHVRPKWTEK